MQTMQKKGMDRPLLQKIAMLFPISIIQSFSFTKTSQILAMLPTIFQFQTLYCELF